MHLRFLPWAAFFIITRIGDIWSTSLFMIQPGGKAGEMNPLASVIGLGFWSLALVNVAVSAILLFGHWHYCAHFAKRELPARPASLSEYVSLLFFGRTGQAWRAWFTAEHNRVLHNTMLAHALVKGFTFVSVLACIHNLGQFHGWALNDHLRALLVRPSLVYYGSMIPLVLYFGYRIIEREYAWMRGDA